MAYVAFTDGPSDSAAIPVQVEAPRGAAQPIEPQRPALSALEWSVVALAERDRLSTLRTPSRVAVALGAFFGERANPRLADLRLEALRRMAVLTWHYGYVVPGSAVRDFVAAGFTLGQYELMVDSIEAARSKRTRRTSR